MSDIYIWNRVTHAFISYTIEFALDWRRIALPAVTSISPSFAIFSYFQYVILVKLSIVTRDVANWFRNEVIYFHMSYILLSLNFNCFYII